jgi:hypothetical protein
MSSKGVVVPRAVGVGSHCLVVVRVEVSAVTVVARAVVGVRGGDGDIDPEFGTATSERHLPVAAPRPIAARADRNRRRLNCDPSVRVASSYTSSRRQRSKRPIASECLPGEQLARAVDGLD